MIYDLQIAWRNIRIRPLETLIAILVVGLAMGLSVAVIVLADGVEEGIVQASDPFGMIVVGAPGSSEQLVLSSILLQGNPTGNIPYTAYEELEEDERVQLAVPLAFGDSVGGARIIGTNRNFFELRRDQTASPTFEIAEGNLFQEVAYDEHDDEHTDEATGEDHSDEAHDDELADDEHGDEEHIFEAVLGADAADALGLKIGDEFLAYHGTGIAIAENLHDDIYQVVGILQPTNTAYDAAVYTPLPNVWEAHADEPDELTLPGVVVEADLAASENQVTSILVLPTGFIEQGQIAQEIYIDPQLQAAFPGEELGRLLGLLSQVQDVFNLVGYLVLFIAALTVFLSMYNAIINREQSIAIMRGLGGSRGDIFRIVIVETLLVTFLGSVLGRVLGYGAAGIIASTFSAQSAIPIPVRVIVELELLLLGLAIVVGILAGLIPALQAYRVDVVEKLFPS